jgi:exodeoxyribonuclease-3
MTRLISWNVNGIRAVNNKGLFVPFVRKHKPDILCLQETKAMQGQAEIDLPDYEEYWHSAEKKGYSGTAIFVRKGLKVKSVVLGMPAALIKKHKVAKDSYGDPNTEGRVLAIELDDMWVVTVYTPNAKESLARLRLRHKQWDPAFLEYMQQLDKKKPVVFSGDLNVAHTYDDLTHPEANEGGHGFTTEERSGIDNIVAGGFIDSFRHFTPKGKGYYTWWSNFSNARSRNVGWRIDYWFVSKKLLPRLKKAAILPEVMGSDHCPVVLELS